MAEEKTDDEFHWEYPKQKVPSEAVDIDPALNRRITLEFDAHVVPWVFDLWS